MTLKSSLLARAAARLPLLLLVSGAAALCAQNGSLPTPVPTPKPKTGFIRFWNLLPKESNVTYELVPAAKPTDKALLTAPPLNYGPSYNVLFSGRYVLLLCQSNSRDKPLKTLDFTMRDGQYVTIVVHPGATPEAPPESEVTVDSIESGQPSDNRLTVWQCLPNARAVTTAGRDKSTQPLSFGASQTLKELPEGVVPVAVSINQGSGPTTRLSSEADFTHIHRVTMFIAKDYYGRLRPMVVDDGPNAQLDHSPVATPPPGKAPTSTASPLSAIPSPR